MLKHVGKHNDKRCVIIFRKIPELDHMALVVYSDLLPRLVHDEIMRTVESPQGQAAMDISEVLFRTIMADGTNCLETIHRNGMLKKVPTNQVLVTPTSNSSVRLDELNDILDEMAKGDEALKRLQDIDASRGMQTKKPRRAEIQELGERKTREAQGNTSAAAMLAGMLSDSELATQRVDQAAKMEATAQQLLAEAARLKREAESLSPKAKDVGTKTKKTTTKKQAA
jgi:hypothetical protein